MKHLLLLCALAAMFTTAFSQDINSGLVGHWAMDEGRDDFLEDTGPYALEGIINHGQWVKGAFGTALRLTGTDSYVTMSTPSPLKGADEMSLSIWAYWEGTGQYPNLISSGWNPGGMMLFVSNEACHFRLGRPGHRANVAGEQWRETGVHMLSPLPRKKWVHLAVVFKRPVLTSYVDGQKQGSVNWDDSIAPADTIMLGRWMGSVTHNGLLDDFRIYKRALSEAEISQLADRTGRDSGRYEIVHDETQAKAIATLETRCATMAIGDNNTILSIKEKGTGRELLDKSSPLVSFTLQDGSVRNPRTMTCENGLFVARIRGLEGDIRLRIEAKGEYFTFTPVSVTVANVQSLVFCQVSPALNKYHGIMSGLFSDDESGLGLRSLSLKVAVTNKRNEGYINARSEAAYGLTAAGVSAALAAGPRAELPAIYKAMENNEPVPKSPHGGVQALESDLTRGSYLFAYYNAANVDDWIALARRGGFTFLHLEGWWKTLGHYEVNTGMFPRGIPDMKAAVDKIHAAGLKASFHTLTACIDPRDSWVTPVPSDDLISRATYTLARPFSETDTVLYVNERPIDGHEVVWSYSCNGNAIKIGKEIIQYTEISREPPYAFKNCTRGAFKTNVSAHAAGDKANYLQQRYIAFYPQPDSQLAEDLADAIAKVYNETDMDGLYFDGSEGMSSRYGIDTMRWKIFQKLKKGAVTEASCWGHNSWWFHSRLGAWDHPRWANRRNHDAHVAQAKNFRMGDFVQPQLGWWAPVGPTENWRGHFPDEMEYFGGKNLSIDGPMSIQGINTSRSPWNARIGEMLTILGWYERIRMANYFEHEDTEKLMAPKADFRLRLDDQGHWRLTPVATDWHIVTNVGNGSEHWSASNPHRPQPYRARVEALYSATPEKLSDHMVLVDFSDLSKISGRQSANGVKQELLVEEADTKLGVRNLRIIATNQRDTSHGAWTVVSQDFPHPYLSMKQGRAFGMWFKGDGSGALLNFQVQTPYVYHGAVSDHYVNLDFTGWKYVELLLRERDSDRMANYEWPYSTNAAAHSICRNAIVPSALNTVKIYLNEIPAHGKVEVTVSPVLSLPQVKHELKNLSLTVNGKIVKLPVTMESGHYLELEGERDCAHYDERGVLLERFQPICPDGWPWMNNGDNDIRFHAESPDAAFSTRAEIVSMALGEPFGRRSSNVNWDWLKTDYDMPRTILKQDGVDNSWSIWQRDEQGASPNDQARLSFELYVNSTGSNLKAYGDARSSTTLDDCARVEPYQISQRNDYAKFAYDSENQGTAKPGVTFEIKHVASGKSADGALQFIARSARSDASGWAATGRRFDKPVDMSAAKSLGFWLKGDASGAYFKVQLRDVKGMWHDMVTPVTFQGWRFIEFELNNVKLDLKQVEYILYYYNNLPAGRSIDDATTEGTLVSCVVDDVRFMRDSCALDTPTFTANGQSVTFPVKLHSGYTLTCSDQKTWKVVDSSRKTIATGVLDTAMPMLRTGRNTACVTFRQMDGDRFRVTASIIKEY